MDESPGQNTGAQQSGTQQASGAQRASQPGGGLWDSVQQLADDVRAALQARVQLLTLEARRAGMALTLMALYAVLAALLGVTAWLSLWALLILLLVQVGVAPAWGLLLAVVVSGAAAWLLIRLARDEARHLLFPATVRQLGRVPPQAGQPAAGTTSQGVA